MIEGERKFPYRDGLLNGAIASKEYVIYECGLLCLCGSECPTRVVQKKRTLKLEIFKTPHKGWGLRTKEKIMKGQFIVEYVGEVCGVEKKLLKCICDTEKFSFLAQNRQKVPEFRFFSLTIANYSLLA